LPTLEIHKRAGILIARARFASCPPVNPE